MSLTNVPDFVLIKMLNKNVLPGVFFSDYESELESRAPHIEPEYDSEGNIITSEVIGYTKEGEAIWSFPASQ